MGSHSIRKERSCDSSGIVCQLCKVNHVSLGVINFVSRRGFQCTNFSFSMAGKIRSGTTEQTTQQQVQLFRTIKQACGADSAEVVEDQKEVGQDTSKYQCSWLSNILPFMHKDALAGRDDEIAISAKSAHKKMREVLTVLSDSDPSETDPDVLNQLVVVNDALDKILTSK